jgi:two-component system NtrC family sensor kinase
VNLKELVAETLALHQKEAAEKEVELIQEMDTGLRTHMDRSLQITQVLINIINNAVHATEPGGKITVTIEGSDDGVVLRIIDTGRGIPREHLKKIFEPFFSTKPPGEGTGLGLFVTRSIMDKLGGRNRCGKPFGPGNAFLHHTYRDILM